MNDLWGAAKVNVPRRNRFDLSHERKMSGNMGKLYPIFWDEVLPGETWSIEVQAFVRFVALLAPIMHFINVSTDTFFVPMRLIWNQSADFFTQGVSGTDAPAYPTFNVVDVYNAISTPNTGELLRTGHLLDALGFPTLPGNSSSGVLQSEYNIFGFSSVSVKAYNLICDYWYRNQSVEASTLPADFLTGGIMAAGDIAALFDLQYAKSELDYLTGCLPAPQRGIAASSLIQSSLTGGPSALVRASAGGAVQTSVSLATDTGGQLKAGANDAYLDPNGSLYVTSQAIRTAEAIQKFYEKRNVAGPQYIAQLRVLFGVVSSDARQQNPEYCGGGRAVMTFSEVLQNSATSGQPTPIATIAGRGVSHGSSGRMGGYFEEHGVIMTILRVVPINGYMNVIERKWTHTSYLDFFWPDFAHLGEQVVYGRETFVDWNLIGGATNHGATFGYNPKYSEYKWRPSLATGQMKESFNYWHQNRKITANPTLSAGWVRAYPDPRIFADVTSLDDHLLVQAIFRIHADRPIPYYSMPGL